MFLYDQYKQAREQSELNAIKNSWHRDTLHIEKLAWPLRTHQIEALSRLEHYEAYLQDSCQERYLLFHMATGSGKTLVMASAILYYYTLGYRQFMFISEKNVLLDKTRQVLCNPDHAKYHFAKPLRYKGKTLTLRAVDTVQPSSDTDIYISFKSIQTLQNELDENKARENATHAEDLKREKTVFLVDEAHHFTDCTNTDEKRWKGVLEGGHSLHPIGLLHLHPENRILGFSATLKEENTAFKEQYQKRVLYNYNFKKYREAGYTKEPELLALNMSANERILLACLNSLYRQYISGKSYDLPNFTPKILVKFPKRTVADEYYNGFESYLKRQSKETITRLIYSLDDGLRIKENLIALIEQYEAYDLLMANFSPYKSRVLLIHGSTKDKEASIRELNHMDEPDTRIRMVFAVDMLNEGWDVLSLFDIVRYAESDSATKQVVLSDVQLIGRGARYYPFKYSHFPDNDKRKSTQGALINNIDGLETLTYFTDTHNRYLAKLKAEAEAQIGGLVENKTPVECVSRLKDSFKHSNVWRKGRFISNQFVEFQPVSLQELESRLKDPAITKITRLNKTFTASSQTYLYSQSDTSTRQLQSNESINWEHMCETDKGWYQRWLMVLLDVMDETPYFRGDSLFRKIQGRNRTAFAETCLNALLPHIVWENYSVEDRNLAEVLADISAYIDSILLPLTRQAIERNMGCQELKADWLYEVMEKRLKDGKVIQLLSNPPKAMDLSKEDFYVFDTFYGNNLEQDVIQKIRTVIASLKRRYQEVYLIRNEGFLKLWGEQGSGFEPDFLLYTYQEKIPQFHYVFIEPKNDKLAMAEQWKQSLLDNVFNERLYTDHKILVLPFVTETTIGQLPSDLENVLLYSNRVL